MCWLGAAGACMIVTGYNRWIITGPRGSTTGGRDKTPYQITPKLSVQKQIIITNITLGYSFVTWVNLLFIPVDQKKGFFFYKENNQNLLAIIGPKIWSRYLTKEKSFFFFLTQTTWFFIVDCVGFVTINGLNIGWEQPSHYCLWFIHFSRGWTCFV